MPRSGRHKRRKQAALKRNAEVAELLAVNRAKAKRHEADKGREGAVVAKNHYYTWARCPIKPEGVLEWIQGTQELSVDKYFIAQEKHTLVHDPMDVDGPANGGVQEHIHAYFGYHKREYVRFSRLHLVGPDGTVYKGNYQAAKSVAHVVSYCSKEDVFLTNIKEEALKSYFRKAKTMGISYSDVIAQARSGDVKTAFETLITVDPRTVILRGPAQVKGSLSALSAKPVPRENPGYKFHDPEFMETWDCTKHALVLVGDSDNGKTTYARFLFKNPHVVTHLDALGKFNADVHDGLVFDDIDFSEKAPELALHLTDVRGRGHINIKYGGVEIPKGTPRVFTRTFFPFRTPVTKELARRIHVVVAGDLRDRSQVQVDANTKPPDQLQLALARGSNAVDADQSRIQREIDEALELAEFILE